LAITRRLVEMFGGKVSVESELGRGSKFRVCVSFDVAQASKRAEPGPSDTPSDTVNWNGREPQILLVEDNLVNQRVVLAVLTKRGFHVEVAGTGLEALKALEKSSYDLVLMDVQMPYMDGIEATKKIRTELGLKQLPIVAMTAHAMNGDRERCLEAGMNDYVSKPVNAQTLVHTILRFLESAATSEAKRETSETAAETTAAVDPLLALEATRGLIDKTLAARLTDNDKNLFQGMLLLFLQMAPERLEKIQAALARGDRQVTERELRKLRSAAERIAAVRIADSANQVMQALDVEESGSIRESLIALETQIHQLSSHVEPKAGGGPGTAGPDSGLAKAS
jgi:CheY-like chemotaxis protein